MHTPVTRGLWVLLGWVLGTALQLQQAALWGAWAYGGLLGGVVFAVLLALAGRRKKRCGYFCGYGAAAGAPVPTGGAWRAVGAAALALCLAACAAFGVTGLRALVFASTALPAALEGRDVWVTGVVADMPQRNASGVRFRFAVEEAQLALPGAQYTHTQPQAVVLPPLLDVAWYSGAYFKGDALPDTALATQEQPQQQPQALQAGERWRMLLRLKAPHGGRNPGGFDYELWLWEQGVQAVGYVRASAGVPMAQRLGATARYPVAQLRQAVRERIAQGVQAPAAGLVAALVVGDQNAIERLDWDVFRATGVAHLVSISGLHITMFAWAAAWGVAWLWRRSRRACLWLPAPTAALWGGVVLATAYAVFAGWGVPAQRTCVMLCTLALLRAVGLRWPWWAVWLAACAVVVAWDPWAMLQAGFWLSFVAVAVLFASAGGASHAGLGKQGPAAAGWRAGWVQRGRALLREQWVVTVALAPLCLLWFGQVSLVGLLANMVSIAWVTLVITPLSMVGVLWQPLWALAEQAIGWWMLLLHWLAAWPGATLALPLAPLWAGVLGVLGGALLVWPGPGAVRVWGLVLVAPVLLWRTVLPQPGEFSLLVADVGQGTAVLVRTAQHALLFDSGPRYSAQSDAGHRVVVPLLQSLQTRLDTLVLSHRDSDHIGGAQAVLDMQPQARVLTSVSAQDRFAWLSHPVERCEAGQRWVWDGVEFEVLHPTAADYQPKAKSNALSCVLRVSNGRQAALLTADIEQAQEAALLAQGLALQADVLLVPHHGSKTSSSAAFLDAVQPHIALVQSGYRNRFGHPALPVVQRYAERGVRLYDSPHCGAMVWESAAPQALACTRQDSLRYWHHRVP